MTSLSEAAITIEGVENATATSIVRHRAVAFQDRALQQGIGKISPNQPQMMAMVIRFHASRHKTGAKKPAEH